MALPENISFFFTRSVPIILQTESTECGLACLGMIANYHGYRCNMSVLRQRFTISLKGATLTHLIQIASQISLNTRAVKLDLDALSNLKLPCILHWNFNHFVVLTDVRSRSVTIIDPGFGKKKLSILELSESFTGVALEVWPNPKFKTREATPNIKLRDLLGPITGLRRSFAIIFALALSLEIFAIINPFFMQWVIDYVLVASDRNLLTTLALGFGLVMLMQQVVSTVRSWVMMYMGTALNVQWRSNVLSHLLHLPVQYFEKRHLGDVISRFGAIDQIQHALTTSFLEGILDGLMTLVTLLMMFIYSSTLGFISVGAMVIYVLVRFIWYQPLKAATEEQIIHAAKQQSHFLETVRGIKAIKLFQRHNERQSAWLVYLVDQINADLKTQKLLIYFKALNALLFGSVNIWIVWLGAKLVMDGNFSIGVLMAFTAYKGQFENRVTSLVDKFFDIKMLQLQGERLADIVMSEVEPLSRVALEENIDSSVPSLELKDVHYHYSEHEPMVLDGVSFKLQPGENVAIVGPSGGGKSTLINVMLGILPAVQGEILLDGVSIDKIGVERLRSIVGTVMQDDVLFAGSISENISFFDPDMDHAWVEACAKAAMIFTEITAMPMGFYTLIGDMGTALSGGQRQRILLARAIYKRPKILFLDEATSQLDVMKEREVNDSIRSLNITRVVVAHRPETIASAKRVLVLERGKISQDIIVDPNF